MILHELIKVMPSALVAVFTTS